MTTALLENEVKESLDRMDNAFILGDAAFFDAFAKDAKIFTIHRDAPITGREDYRNAYQDALTGSTREKTILKRTMQVVGDKCVVNQTARINENGSAADVSQTLVYGLTDEGVKILHFHTGLLTPTGEQRNVVKVVHEKIATTMTASGVAQ
jgi:hypothetical protein